MTTFALSTVSGHLTDDSLCRFMLKVLGCKETEKKLSASDGCWYFKPDEPLIQHFNTKVWALLH